MDAVPLGGVVRPDPGRRRSVACRWPVATSVALVSPHGFMADLTLAVPLVALVWDP